MNNSHLFDLFAGNFMEKVKPPSIIFNNMVEKHKDETEMLTNQLKTILNSRDRHRDEIKNGKEKQTTPWDLCVGLKDERQKPSRQGPTTRHCSLAVVLVALLGPYFF